MKIMKYINLIVIMAAIAAIVSCQPQDKKSTAQNEKNTANIPNRKWWKEAVVYQIYPRSFKDSNGDGIGDLKGIISKLNYVKSLGVNVIWLNPIFASPNRDNGYDISNYRKIMKQFGNMNDFDTLVSEIHRHGLKLILDLVVNHTSNEHRWFKQSRSSRNNPYRNYYHWWPAERGKPPKRYSYFDVDHNAWKYDSTTNAYYLHYFGTFQPDLNWENPKVRQAIYKIMRFWLNKGIDGFRMDVIPFIAKDTTFPKMPAKYHGNWAHFYANGPHLHEYLKEMNKEVLSKYPNIMTVAEGAGVTSNEVLKFINPSRHELNMLYNFEAIHLGMNPETDHKVGPKRFNLVTFKEIYTKWDSVIDDKGWGTIWLGNHDTPRMVTHWGNDTPQFRAISSKMLTTFLMTMHATPFYYNGDELGMTNIKFDSIKDYRDVATLHAYQHLKETGGNLKKFLNREKLIARDNSRTPFQWDTTRNAGFTTGHPWIKVNPNYKTINVETEERNPNSVLNYFKKIIRLRKKNLILIYGKYTLLDKDNPDVYAYTRELNGKKDLVLLNFTTHKAQAKLSFDMGKARLLIDNYSTVPDANAIKTFTLRPYEAAVFELR